MTHEMRPDDLKIGALYQLTRDVENPLKDGRSANYFLGREVFKKGARFVCLPADMAPGVRRLHPATPTVGGQPCSDGFTVGVHSSGEGFRLSKFPRDQNWTAAIVPHLEEVAVDTWDKMQSAYGWAAMRTVLRGLVEDGTVPLERVIELMRQVAVDEEGPAS